MKKVLSILLSFILLLGTINNISAADIEAVNDIMKDTAEYLYETVSNPEVGAVGGEWTVLGLARSGAEIPKEYYQNYYINVEKYVKEADGILHEKKYTEYSRVILALTAIGKEPTNVAGYNLLTLLGDYDKTIWQGLNGAIWALIALDSGRYEIPDNVEAQMQADREMYIKRILECEIEGGGWALSEDNTSADTDITAMALVALSNYKTHETVLKAIERGIEKLSEMQNENGGYSNYNAENSESAAQVLTAISSLGISYKDSRFVKNGNTLIDNILSFYNEGKGFMHTGSAASSNLMATEQCFYALVAAKRLENNQNAFFDMSDCINIDDNEKTFGLPGKNSKIVLQEKIYKGKTFDDIKNHKNQSAIEGLSSRGIINGINDTFFCPDNSMTRAEFAAIVVKALGIPLSDMSDFADVSESDWFYSYVGTAFDYGIVNGISESLFNPGGTITREEAAVMVTRAAKLCGMNTDMELFAAKNILAEFVDYIKVSEWAVKSVAFCYEKDILDRNQIKINSNGAITRAEVAQMIYNMLGKAELL